MPNLLRSVGPSPCQTPEIDARIEAQKRNLDNLLQRYTDCTRRGQHAPPAGRPGSCQGQGSGRAAAPAAAAPLPPASAGTENLAVQELNRMMATAEVQVAAMQARVDEYAGRYSQMRESLKTAPQVEAEAAQLNRDYAITKKNYEDLVARRQSAVMSGELDVASGVAEFSLIDPPRVSPKPVSPNRCCCCRWHWLPRWQRACSSRLRPASCAPLFLTATNCAPRRDCPAGVVTGLISDEDRA
jgi:uncharacterized coiled-coil protein SlyX